MSKKYKNVKILDHPVLRHKISILRDRETNSAHFRLVMHEISQLLTYEATHDLTLFREKIDTPMEKTNAEFVADKIAIIAIMRAGNAMLDGMIRILPFASMGHIGIYRDKFIHNTIEYYFRLPKDVKGRRILLVDPLLATGDTAVAAIERLKQYQVGKIRLVCLLAAPEGIEKVHQIHPDVEIYTISVERGLNKDGYILPGIGDAGDRLYNTDTEVL